MSPRAVRVYLMGLRGYLCHFSHCLHHITSDAMTHYLRSCTSVEGHYRSPRGRAVVIQFPLVERIEVQSMVL
jgi:hypothetical protein